MFCIDGKLFAAISKFGDLVILNILFIVCCIPIVTIGASITALYGVTKKMAVDKEGYIVAEFFRQWKNNFGQATAMWLLLLPAIGVLSADLYAGTFISNNILQILYEAFILLAVIIVLFLLIYTMALQSTFENKIKNTFKNALLISIAHLPWSALIVFIALSPFFSLVCLRQYFSLELLLILLVWFSGGAYLNSIIFNKIFQK